MKPSSHRLHARAPLAAVLFLALGACSQGEEGEGGAKILSFASSSTRVRTGATVTLTWKAENATSIRLSAEPGGTLVDAAMAEGSFTSAALNAQTVFTLTVSDGEATDTQTITVEVEESIPMIVLFDATPNPGLLNGQTVLRWNVRSAKTVRVLANGVEILPPSTTLAETGTLAASLRQPMVAFTLEAQNETGKAVSQVMVAAEERPEILTFNIEPQIVETDTATVGISWSTVRARTVTLTANGNPVPGFSGAGSGMFEVTVMGTTTFELVAMSAAGSTARQVLVSRNPAEVEPNDTPRSAFPADSGRVLAALDRPNDVDYFQITLPMGGNILAETSDGMGSCSIDTDLELYARDGVTLLGGDTSSGPVNPRGGPCARIDPRLHPFAVDLAPGTYYLAVRGNQMGVGPYVLEVMVLAPRCGDQIIERSLSEECDDGNTMPGDGCDMSCRYSGPAEIEPNETSSTATTLMANQPVLRGVVQSTMDVDFYRITPAAGDSLEAWITASGLNACDNALQMQLTLMGNDGVTEAVTEVGTGPGMDCGRITPVRHVQARALMRQPYYLRVTAPTITASTTYYLHTRLIAAGCGNLVVEGNEQCDDGNMTNGDGCSRTCQYEIARMLQPPGGRTMINLGPGPSYGAVTVQLTQAGQSITATTSDGATACPVDTKLTLRSATAVVGTKSLGGIFPCGRIDPRTDAWAANLPAGTYTVVVENEGTAPGAIQLDVGVLAAACGDGILSTRANEQCDDGNRANGDGCSSSCRFEMNQIMESEPNDSTMDADALPVMIPGSAFAQGALTMGESDFYVIELSRTATLIARTQGNMSDPNSCQGDTKLTLLDAQGMPLAVNQDISGTNFCSLIDGTSASHPGAANLQAGRYYLQVEAFNRFTSVPAYVLAVRLQL